MSCSQFQVSKLTRARVTYANVNAGRSVVTSHTSRARTRIDTSSSTSIINLLSSITHRSVHGKFRRETSDFESVGTPPAPDSIGKVGPVLESLRTPADHEFRGRPAEASGAIRRTDPTRPIERLRGA